MYERTESQVQDLTNKIGTLAKALEGYATKMTQLSDIKGSKLDSPQKTSTKPESPQPIEPNSNEQYIPEPPIEI